MDTSVQNEVLAKWIAELNDSTNSKEDGSFLLDLFDVGLFVIASDGEILFSNNTFIKLFKNNPLIDKNNFFELLASPEPKYIFDSLKSKSQFFGEISWKSSTSYRFGDFKLKAYICDDQNILVGSIRDITHRKNNEKQKTLLMQDTLSELSAAQDMLMESTKMATIGKLSVEINHELQMPLQAISLSQDFLIDRMKELKIEDEQIKSIIKDMSRATDKIKRQLDTLKSKSDASPNETEKVNSGDMILNSINYFSHKSRVKGIKVLADVKSHFTIECNYDKFENVILNLIRNAFDAHLEDTEVEKERYIKISSFEDSNHFQMAVEDNGPGVSDKLKNQIFEPFFSTKVNSGTGIGLSLSRRYIQELGGDIFLNQTPGKTRFQISIPKKHYEE